MAKSAGQDPGSKTKSKPAGRKSALSRSAARVTSKASGQNVRGSVSGKPRGRTRAFFGEVKIEMTKVTWPSRKELIQSTGVVVVVVIIAGIYIGVFDFVWSYLVTHVGLG
jgi:preprotein translocase subunit SecE